MNERRDEKEGKKLIKLADDMLGHIVGQIKLKHSIRLSCTILTQWANMDLFKYQEFRSFYFISARITVVRMDK